MTKKQSKDFLLGYEQAMKDINTPMLVKHDIWNSSECPRCKEDFREYEECVNDRWFQNRCLVRCPNCGQALTYE